MHPQATEKGQRPRDPGSAVTHLHSSSRVLLTPLWALGTENLCPCTKGRGVWGDLPGSLMLPKADTENTNHPAHFWTRNGQAAEACS